MMVIIPIFWPNVPDVKTSGILQHSQGTTDDAQASSRDVSADVDNENQSELGSIWANYSDLTWVLGFEMVV